MTTFRSTFATSTAVVLASTVFWSVSAVAQSSNAYIEIGRLEYEANCAACHGAEAKGNGPVAEVLTVQPTDLTQISQRSGGTFPRDYVFQIIDGRNVIGPHGSGEMPVWGRRFMTRAVEQSAAVPWDVDARAIVLGRETALVQYLESIQAEE